MKQFTLFFILSSLLLTGCYRYARDDDFSIVPMTNNPDVTRESQGTATPNVAF
jgi:hypothetical protein